MNDNKLPYVLVMGPSIVDIIGFSKENYKSKDSIPGKIKITFGGVCRNIAENLARVKINTRFISILGEDDKGKNILAHSKKIGLDMSESLIIRGGVTPTYMAILNEKGEMASAVVDMSVINKMDFSFIDSKKDIINKAEYVFLGANNPTNLEYIVTNFKGKFVLDTISAAKAKNVVHLIKYFHTIKPNRQEAEVLAGFKIKNDEDLKKAGDYFLKLGIKNIFISLDEDGVYYANKYESGKIKANKVTVKNVTGAGDSFVAGIGYGYMNNMSIEEITKYSIAMSLITLSHEETINPQMCHEKVQEYLKNTNFTQVKY